MSPNINSFVGDLVAMAQAMEELPKAQALIEDLRKQLDDAQRHNQGLEQNILGYKSDIAHWQDQAKVLSDQRDNAELRAMELEDRNNAVSRFLGSLVGDANSLRNIIDPPKPEPTPEPQPGSISTDGPHSDTTSMAFHDDLVASYASSADVPQAMTGQSASDPSVQHTTNPTNASSPHATSGDVGFGQTEHSAASPETPQSPVNPPQPYANVNYISFPGWVSRQDWLAGGGTNESYDYRPPVSGPDTI